MDMKPDNINISKTQVFPLVQNIIEELDTGIMWEELAFIKEHKLALLGNKA